MYIYVHYHNQLMRNMKYTHKIRSFQGINIDKNNNALTLDLNYVGIMRKREDANMRCNVTLHNDDRSWMQRVIRVIGCIPPYWKVLYEGGRVNTPPQCNTSNQLRNVSRYLPFKNELMVKTVLRKYHPPCHRMRVYANTNNDRYPEADILKIKFKFR